MFLREFGTGFDVGEKEGDCAGGEIIHGVSVRMSDKVLLLEPEVDKNTPKVFVVFLDAVIEFFDVTLIQKPQHLFLELSTAFAGDDLNQFDPLFDGFLHDAVQFRVDLVAAIVDFVQVEFEFCHYILGRKSKGGC
jgi:hypothetical protein